MNFKKDNISVVRSLGYGYFHTLLMRVGAMFLKDDVAIGIKSLKNVHLLCNSFTSRDLS